MIAEVVRNQKRVDYSQSFDGSRPIPPCCDRMGPVCNAVPSVRLDKDGLFVECGYALESPECDCDSRWVPHDWRKGHAVFERVRP